jgi:hypothetical protein
LPGWNAARFVILTMILQRLKQATHARYVERYVGLSPRLSKRDTTRGTRA